MPVLPLTSTNTSIGRRLDMWEDVQTDTSGGNAISRVMTMVSDLVPTQPNTGTGGPEQAGSPASTGAQPAGDQAPSDLTLPGSRPRSWGLARCCSWKFQCSPVSSLLRLYWRYRRHINFLVFLSILLVHIATNLIVLEQVATRTTIFGWPSFTFGIAALICLNIPYLSWLTFEAMRKDTSVAVWQASFLFLTYWAHHTVVTLAKTFDQRWLWMLTTITEPLTYFITVLCIAWRIGMAEMGFQVKRGEKGCAKYILAWPAVLSPTVAVRYVFWATWGVPDYHFVMDLVERAIKTVSFVSIYFLCRRSLHKINLPLENFPEALHTRRYLKAEVTWAKGILSDLQQTEIWLCCSGVIEHSVWLMTAVTHFTAESFVHTTPELFQLSSNLILITNLIVFLHIYKKLQQDRPTFPKVQEQEKPLHEQRAEELHTTRNDSYNKTVADLAQRYITASELLDFYVHVLQVMDFKPDRHCTNDVVKAVILPATCSQGTACSGVPYTHLLQERRAATQRQQQQQQQQQQEQDEEAQNPPPEATPSTTADSSKSSSDEAGVNRQPLSPTRSVSSGMGRFSLPDELPQTYAQRMVTHEWRNLFVYLVAAVIADALNQGPFSDQRRKATTYGHIAGKLGKKAGITGIRRALERAGRGDVRYWICTFCVNQHRAGKIPEPAPDSPEFSRYEANMCDSVTHLPLPKCTCSNRQEWCEDDCEMDKFDYMMAELQSADQELSHVVVIGKTFEIFKRAWCVAELVEANCSKIKQNVCIISKEVLDANTGDIRLYTQLAMLSIGDCSASRASDKERILRKVERSCGIEEFDAQLQATIFGEAGLLGRRLLGFDAIHAAGRVAARAELADKSLRGLV